MRTKRIRRKKESATHANACKPIQASTNQYKPVQASTRNTRNTKGMQEDECKCQSYFSRTGKHVEDCPLANEADEHIISIDDPKTYIEGLWIDIKDQMPPNKQVDIFVYNYKIKKVFVTDAYILNAQLSQVQTKELFDNWKGKMDPHIYHTGYYVSHWCPIFPPPPPEE